MDEVEDHLGLPSELTDVLDRTPSLSHAQALLALQGQTVFDKGAEPYQSADVLRAKRDGLVHPKAEWDDARDRSKSLSRKIIGARLPLSPFQQDPAVAFPYGCMSAGVAKWAELSARMFIRELRDRLGLVATV